MEIENESLFKHHLANGINLFLGAGFSVLADGPLGQLPVGDTLKNELCKKFLKKDTSLLQLPQVCRQIKSSQKNELNSYLTTRFTVKTFSPKYQQLKSVNISNIFTTNIDNLIHCIFDDSEKFYINDVFLRGPSFADKSGIDYTALHGCILYPNSDFDFTTTEIASSFFRDRNKWEYFIQKVDRTPTLYWGYRLEDAGTLQSFSIFTENSRMSESWIQLCTKDEDAIAYYKSLGLQYIICDTKELLDFCGKITPIKKKTVVPGRLEFPEYDIPKLNKVPVRTKDEFYSGAEPSWYDIYTNCPIRTEHILSMKDKIAEVDNVLLTGPPASGKTTLMMQLALDFSQSNKCLYIEDINDKKAQMLCRDCLKSGVKPFIFIDNAADYISSIEIITESKCYEKLIISDRDYFIDLVEHKVSCLGFEEYNMAVISKEDLQKIQSAIPDHIKINQFSLEIDEDGTEILPSMFDIIKTVVARNSIFMRFESIIEQYKEDNELIYDLILVSSYFYSCRIPTSVDVMHSYYSKRMVPLDKTYEIMKTSNGITKEHEYSPDDDDELFVVSQSRILANSILNWMNQEELQSMLNIIHFHISPTRIHRYDIFKRYCFDAKIVKRAFPNYIDGLKFYEECFLSDNSFYIRQQCALYLSEIGEHEIAFRYIDEARSMSFNKNLSIRNSFAVIQFRANINKKMNDDVKRTLEESMKILSECYKFDTRKRMHARAFAAQALSYAQKTTYSSKAIEYIEIAIPWLESQLAERPHDRNFKQLTRQLKQILRRRRR